MFALGTSSQTRGFFSTTRGLIAGRFSSVSPGQRLFIFLSEDETQRLTSRVAQSPVSNRRLSCSSIKSNELCRVDMTDENWPVRNDICHWSLANSHLSFQSRENTQIAPPSGTSGYSPGNSRFSVF